MKDYKKILEGVVSIINTAEKSDIGFANICSYIGENCPELKESEGERMRKWIINYLSNRILNSTIIAEKENLKKAIAWLEKQGGQIPADKTEPKFKVKYAGSEYNVFETKELAGVTFYGIEDEPNHIDYVKEENCDIISGYAIEENGSPYPTKPAVFSEQKSVYKIEPKFKVGEWIVWQNKCYKVNYNGCGYELVDQNGLSTSLEYGTIDENAHLFTVKDAKNGDVLCYKGEISLYKHDIKNCTKQEPTFGGFVYYCCYDGKRFITDSFYSLTEQDKTDIHPATKEQRDTLMKAIADAGYIFDFEKKELKKIEPFDEYEGLTDFERTLTDICIGWIGQEPGWKEYIKDNADVLLKIAVEKFNAIQDVPFEQNLAEEVNGEDYGIDGLYHAQRILEKTLGSVDGYQSDDGILDHKAAITAVKKLYKQKPAEWSEDDEIYLDNVFTAVKAYYTEDKGHENPWREELLRWLKSLKDRIQPKQEWSEEDEKRLTKALVTLNDAYASKELLDWVESLKDRYTWKPSDEQMNALNYVVNLMASSERPTENDLYYNILKSLRQQLKKLREE